MFINALFQNVEVISHLWQSQRQRRMGWKSWKLVSVSTCWHKLLRTAF